VELLGFLLGAFLILLLARAVIRIGEADAEAEEELEDTPPPRRVSEFCARLTGEPDRDRPLQNRILALGDDAVTPILEYLSGVTKDPERFSPDVQARLEEILGDFGLLVVDPVADRLARVRPSSPLGPVLLRVIERLGAPGVRALLDRAVRQPMLLPFVPRWRRASAAVPEPASTVFAVLRDLPRGQRTDGLAAMAGVLGEHPEVLDRLWDRWDADGRLVLVVWMGAWLPLMRPAVIEAALGDEDPEVRAAAARTAGLSVSAPLVAALCILARQDPDPGCRWAAVHALATSRHVGSRDGLAAALQDPVAEVAAEALLGLFGGRIEELPGLLARAPSLAGHAHGELIRGGCESVEPLLAALDGDDAPARGVAMPILAAYADRDPRARERLIRAADGADPTDRARAVAALASIGDPSTKDLLGRAVRDEMSPMGQLLLQEAAQQAGPSVAVPLARRLRPDHVGRAATLLAILRVVDYTDAVPVMLRALESASGTWLEGPLAASIHLGGAASREAVDGCLKQPGRGLLTAAVTWMSAYATPDDVAVLMALFDRHMPMRGVLLNLIEAQGPAAEPALAARVEVGGDDSTMLAVERRLAVMRAVRGGGSVRARA
jgi:hypothetical protein